MKKKKYLFKYLFLSAFIFLFVTSPVLAGFNPNYIISDDEMLDADSMSLVEIEQFLKNKGGYISNHSFQDAHGVNKTAAEIIYDATNNYDCETSEMYKTLTEAQKKIQCEPTTINPKLLLVLLQKEQSLIEEKSPTKKQLDWATGYGVCDNCSMSDSGIQRFKGFGKQINSASLQFFDYLKNPTHYTYRAGNTYDVSNTGKPNIIVTPQNQATAALYNYTPHVYNGNYNFYNLWMRYFTLNYPNGTLMQVRGEPGVWIIKNNEKRPFLTKGALTSRYDANKIVQINKTDLDKYPTGAPIKFPQYSLIRSPRGTIFLLVDDKRRGFASAEAFRKIGYNPEEVMNASWEDINAYEEGLPITATSTYPTGALLQDNTTGGVFYVSEGTKAPLWSSVLLKTKYKWKSITPVSPEKLASYRTIEPAIFGDGELIKSENSAGVYVIDNKQKRVFVSGKIFEELGYKWSNIITVPQKILDLYINGDPIKQIYRDEEELDIDSETASSTVESLASSTKETESLEDEINSILNP